VKDSGIDYEFRTTVHSAYTSAEDILTIAADISPAKRYILQGFVSRDKHVDDNSRQGNSITPSDLNIIKEQIVSKGLIDEVLIR
jgi:pyruvate formate lyase activating enzyme